MGNLVIGICGGSGSGKTTLADAVAKQLGGKAVLLSMDSFYKYQPNKTYEERCKTNYDHPDAFDTDVMVQCIKTLKEGRDTKIPVYDYTIHNRSEEPWQPVKSAPIIIVEGILLFAFPEVTDLLDYKIFVDTSADIRILRRAVRDVTERARSLESVMTQYLETVGPMHDRYVEPYKDIADIIVPENHNNPAGLKLLVNAILWEAAALA